MAEQYAVDLLHLPAEEVKGQHFLYISTPEIARILNGSS